MALSQPGIFNVLDYGMVGGESGLPDVNRQALQQAIYAAQAQNGGTVLIPAEDGEGNGVYRIYGPIYVGSATSLSPVAIIIAGTGQGTEDGPTLLVENNSTLFSVDTSAGGDEHIGGITFQDLSIKYDQDGDGNTYSGTAIDVVSAEHVRMFRVVFVDCEQAVWFEESLGGSLLECTAVYQNTTASPACVTIGNDASGVAAKETYIAGCRFLANKKTGGGVGLIIQGSEHVRVSNTLFDAFFEGIKIIPGAAVSGGHNALRLSFYEVQVYTFDGDDSAAGTALTIQPQGPQDISQIVFTNCAFEPSAMAKMGSVGPGIYIDEGLYGSTVDNVRFVSCFSSRWSGPGMEITSGSNIEINGGFFSGNASGADPSGGSGGISITGAASGVRIIGASCVGSYQWVEIDGTQTSAVQDVGISISGGGATNIIIDHCDLRGNSQYAVALSGGAVLTAGVFIRNCNMQGYTGNPISFGADLSIIAVTSCSGYNDQAAAVTTTAPANNATFSGSTYGYYGPVTFTATGGSITQIEIDGHNTNLTSGVFTLGPRDTAKLTYSGIGMTFVMIGQ
jgi:hypothetical protein